MWIPFFDSSLGVENHHHLHYTTNHESCTDLFCWPPDPGHQGGATVSHHFHWFPGCQTCGFRGFFWDQKSLGIFDRGFSTPQLREALGCETFDLQMHLKGMYLQEIHNLYAYSPYVWLVYKICLYSLYIHVWLIYFYRIHWTIAYLPARDGWTFWGRTLVGIWWILWLLVKYCWSKTSCTSW